VKAASVRTAPLLPLGLLDRGFLTVNNDENEVLDDASILNFEVDDIAIELAATGVGTIPTASVNMVPPNCCVQQKR
jgi:hypothetical protein